MTRTSRSDAPVTVRYECPICGGPHNRADHRPDHDPEPSPQDASRTWWWTRAKEWTDCHGCGATIEAGDVVAYRAVDGMLVDVECAERERLDARPSKGLTRQAVKLQ